MRDGIEAQTRHSNRFLEQAEETELRHATEKAAAIKAAAHEAAKNSAVALQEATRQHRRKISRALARYIMSVTRIATSIVLAYLLYLLSTDFWEINSTGKLITAALLAFLLILANLDLFGSKVVKSTVRASQSWIEEQLYCLLLKLDPSSDNQPVREEPHLRL